jgi:hypothetical protein
MDRGDDEMTRTSDALVHGVARSNAPNVRVI